ncbi:hypothetical protein PBOI14_29430 [Pseudomonas sp. Boi14]|nr:hypothetical protein PBOI14_29430 [Pseudomonas sp. Boi14]
MFQMGGIGPMFGQVGFFNKFAGREYEDKRPLERYVNEAKRLLGVLDKHLGGASGSWASAIPLPISRPFRGFAI